ncbi:hypothetical protein M3649_03895 [Ureibacillus chungkukjangi]|uniref:hypothetical protein n=1 Tax=Ureibacillus chungkukjangi TaxID=1202712 RepID=UPI00203A90C1|nr:hypothetical protein [Ureibacillus chungkukjangi]MCM3387274.1 hypothetical protein [Ureibacillus chungkukjangi]
MSNLFIELDKIKEAVTDIKDNIVTEEDLNNIKNNILEAIYQNVNSFNSKR